MKNIIIVAVMVVLSVVGIGIVSKQLSHPLMYTGQFAIENSVLPNSPYGQPEEKVVKIMSQDTAKTLCYVIIGGLLLSAAGAAASLKLSAGKAVSVVANVASLGSVLYLFMSAFSSNAVSVSPQFLLIAAFNIAGIVLTVGFIKEVTSYATTRTYTEQEQAMINQGGWVCPECGKINASYVDMCACGASKKNNSKRK